MAVTTERTLNLVTPPAHKVGAMRSTDTAASSRARSGAVSTLIGESLRRGDMSSVHVPSTRLTTPGIRTSTTATRTSTTRTTPVVSVPSADSTPPALSDLVQAHLDCRRRKRNTLSAIAFEQHLERNLYELHQELLDGRYRPGKSVCFVITRPKPREVWAADYRDRVVHHLLYNHIAQRFIASFVPGSSACIPGRGTLYAAKRLESDIRSITQNWSKRAFYLKCDLSNFFVSINKHIVFKQLSQKVGPGWWRDLARTILFHDPRTNVDVRGRLHLVPPHKSLFQAPDNQGLPIGNLDSQFLANVHLNALDQFVVHQLRCKYVRYVDDFVLLHESPKHLERSYLQIQSFLAERLQLEVNPTKTALQPLEHGVDFVGHVIRPWRRTVRPKTMNVALARLKQLPADQLYETGNSYLGLTSQATHGHADAARIANALRRRGHYIASDLSKAYRRKRHE